MICMPWQTSLGLLSQNLPRILSKPTFHDRFLKNHVIGPYPEPYKSRLHDVVHLRPILIFCLSSGGAPGGIIHISQPKHCLYFSPMRVTRPSIFITYIIIIIIIR